MKYIVLVGHGSRDPRGNEEILEFVELFKEQHHFQNVEACFLEFAEPDIPSKLDECVAKGAQEVIVIPLILLPAGHTKLHIPGHIDEARQRHQGVVFTYGKPIGEDLQITHILQERLQGTLEEFAEKGEEIDPDKTALLVTGRGSSDPDANSTLFRISRLIWEKLPYRIVETAFMGVTSPLLSESLKRCRMLGAQKIIVLPYFLFTGILIERMIKQTAEFTKEHPDAPAVVADYMGFHPYLAEIVARRIEETLGGDIKMNCDLCQYRSDFAQKNPPHHHHHHGTDHDHAHKHDHISSSHTP